VTCESSQAFYSVMVPGEKVWLWLEENNAESLLGPRTRPISHNPKNGTKATINVITRAEISYTPLSVR